jgi:hypothetical protein
MIENVTYFGVVLQREGSESGMSKDSVSDWVKHLAHQFMCRTVHLHLGIPSPTRRARLHLAGAIHEIGSEFGFFASRALLQV